MHSQLLNSICVALHMCIGLARPCARTDTGGDGGLQLPPPAPASTFFYRGSTARETVQIFGGMGTRTMHSPLFLPIHHWSHTSQ
jgi:hypothetical protein